MANDQDDLQAHLNSSIYGPPQTNPDERRQYLGSLRERCALFISNAEMAETTTLPAFTARFATLQKEADYSMLLNGKLDSDLTTPYLAAASQANFPFTLVNDDTANTAPTSCGLAIVAKTAINATDIRLTAPTPPTTGTPEKKQSFFGKLFK